jgi:hypothetical protein
VWDVYQSTDVDVIDDVVVETPSGPIMYRTEDEDGTDTVQQDGGGVVNRAHRKAASEGTVKKDHGRRLPAVAA